MITAPLENSPSLVEKNEDTQPQKPKRLYVKFPLETLTRLNGLYHKRSYPSKREMQKLSNITNEPIKKLENWFKHKRRTDLKNGSLKFSKKKIFSTEEKAYLMNKFRECRNPSYAEYKLISKELKCPMKHLKNWFCYQRKVQSQNENPNEIAPEIPPEMPPREEKIEMGQIKQEKDDFGRLKFENPPRSAELNRFQTNGAGLPVNNKPFPTNMFSQYQQNLYQNWMLFSALNQQNYRYSQFLTQQRPYASYPYQFRNSHY